MLESIIRDSLKETASTSGSTAILTMVGSKKELSMVMVNGVSLL
jgi:hypothetical protein